MSNIHPTILAKVHVSCVAGLLPYCAYSLPCQVENHLLVSPLAIKQIIHGILVMSILLHSGGFHPEGQTDGAELCENSL